MSRESTNVLEEVDEVNLIDILSEVHDYMKTLIYKPGN